MDKLQAAISSTDATVNALKEFAVLLIQGGETEEAQRVLAQVRQTEERREQLQQMLARLTKTGAKPAKVVE